MALSPLSWLVAPYSASNLLSRRHICAELHWRVRDLAAASAESDSRNNSRENDQPLYTRHGLIS